MNIVAVVRAGLVCALSVSAVSGQSIVNRNGRIADVFDTPAAKSATNSRTVVFEPPPVNVPATSYTVTPAAPVVVNPAVTTTTLRIKAPTTSAGPVIPSATDPSAFGNSGAAKSALSVTPPAPSFPPTVVTSTAPSFPSAVVTPAPPSVFPSAPVAPPPVISRAPIAPIPTAFTAVTPPPAPAPRYSSASVPAPRITATAFESRGPSGTKSYVMSPNDLVEVKVFQEPDLDSRVRVSKDGTVTLPLIGSVRFAGRTVDEATAIVRDTLDRRFIVNPQVNLTVVDYAKRRFTVMGEVQKPGSFEIPNEETVNLLQALALAGGYTRIGEPTKVTVVRVEGGQRVVHKLNAKAMARDQKSKPFEIQADDTITVGESVF